MKVSDTAGHPHEHTSEEGWLLKIFCMNRGWMEVEAEDLKQSWCGASQECDLAKPYYTRGTD